MTDKYSKEVIAALNDAINHSDANHNDRDLVNKDQLVIILESLDNQGYCVRKKSLVRWPLLPVEPTGCESDDVVMTEPFKVLITLGELTYSTCVVKRDGGEFVPEDQYTSILISTALNTTMKEVNGDNRLTIEQIKLEMIKSLDKQFKDYPAFKGIVFQTNKGTQDSNGWYWVHYSEGKKFKVRVTWLDYGYKVSLLEHPLNIPMNQGRYNELFREVARIIDPAVTKFDRSNTSLRESQVKEVLEQTFKDNPFYKGVEFSRS